MRCLGTPTLAHRRYRGEHRLPSDSAEAAVDLERLDGGSEAMAQARLRLRAYQAMTDFAASGDTYRLALEATS